MLTWVKDEEHHWDKKQKCRSSFAAFGHFSAYLGCVVGFFFFLIKTFCIFWLFLSETWLPLLPEHRISALFSKLKSPFLPGIFSCEFNLRKHHSLFLFILWVYYRTSIISKFFSFFLPISKIWGFFGSSIKKKKKKTQLHIFV